MAIITVVGAGVMGTALTFPAADNGHTVRLVGTHLDTAIIDSVRADGTHPRLKRKIPESVTAYYHTDIAEAMQDAEVIIVGVNSQGTTWGIENIGPHLVPGQILQLVTKGLETLDGNSISILPDVWHAKLPEAIRDKVHYAAIGGPSIAGELAARHHTAVVFVCKEAEIAEKLRGYFLTDYYHIWTSTDMIGVELCVALKNPYAFAAGLAAGVLEAKENAEPDVAGAKMHNFSAAVFAQGLAETAYLVEKMGGGMETVYSLPGAGDLHVTTQGGRNSRFGRLIGMGLSYSDAVEEMPGETIEGVDAIIAVGPAIETMVENGSLDGARLPLFRQLYRILTKHEPAMFNFDSFFAGLPFNPPPKK
ncbi:MAG: glycerol-3-phosphate dehydrogenase [Chloroflexota bacterium]